jgi:hypothetical protein
MKRSLKSIVQILSANSSKFSSLEAQYGKPIRQARQDVEESIKVFKYYLNLLESTQPLSDRTVRKPLGTVGKYSSVSSIT